MFNKNLNHHVGEFIFSYRVIHRFFVFITILICFSNSNDLRADNKKPVAQVVSANFDQGDIKLSIQLLRPFDWKRTRFVSKKTFPGNAPPWLPGPPPRTRHQLTWAGGGMFEWFQYDFIELGNYQFTDDFTVRTELFGSRVIVGVFNPITNTLLYDGLEYVPFLPVPTLKVHVSNDMKEWNEVKNIENLKRDSDNGDAFSFTIKRAVSRAEYISVDVTYE